MGEVGLWSDVCAVGFVIGNAGSYVEPSSSMRGGGPSKSSWSSGGWSDHRMIVGWSVKCFEALGLWLLLSGVLFCSRCRFVLFSFIDFLTQLNSSSRVVSTILSVQDVGVLSSVSINASVEARVFVDAGYIYGR